MISTINTSASALSAFSTGMNVTANNIANINTDNFKKQDVVMEEVSHGGVKAVVSQEENVKEDLVALSEINPDATAVVEDASDVSLAEEMVNTMAFNKYYEASVKSLGVADSMKGTVVDMLA